MGRIEYEYPLFKVYYSNNSNNSNIRGNPGVSISKDIYVKIEELWRTRELVLPGDWRQQGGGRRYVFTTLDTLDTVDTVECR